MRAKAGAASTASLRWAPGTSGAFLAERHCRGAGVANSSSLLMGLERPRASMAAARGQPPSLRVGLFFFN